MTPSNLLFLLSDEHSREYLGCAGHPLVETPHLDRLAAAGTRFTAAYTPSPICIPARASLATGRYVHQIRHWDSAEPYDGSTPGWGHRLIAEGHRVVSIGKLHFRDSADANGFDEEILPMHVLDGIGWPLGLLRSVLPPYDSPREYAEEIGAGWTDYTRYDSAICARACDWLRRQAGATDKPWVLFVSFVSPHYPLIAPPEYFARYPLERIDLPRDYDKTRIPAHPQLREMRAFWNYDDYFPDEIPGRDGAA
jgi:choline-sulfatase